MNFWPHKLLHLIILTCSLLSLSLNADTKLNKEKEKPEKLFFRSGEVSASLNSFMIEARKNVAISYKKIKLKTSLAYLYFNKDKSLKKIVAPNKALIIKDDLRINANKLTYYLKSQMIVSQGSTKIQRKNSTITGRNIKYNLITDELVGEDISGIL